jgi:hypothetical protein
LNSTSLLRFGKIINRVKSYDSISDTATSRRFSVKIKAPPPSGSGAFKFPISRIEDLINHQLFKERIIVRFNFNKVDAFGLG